MEGLDETVKQLQWWPFYRFVAGMSGDEEDGRVRMSSKRATFMLKIQGHLKMQFSVFVDNGRTCHM